MGCYPLLCAVWEFTLKCNLKCEHCGSSAGCAREDELTDEQTLLLCEDLAAAGCKGVALMGGEPLLRPNWFEVASKINELGMQLSIITNGTILSEDIINKLKILNPRAVSVSLDGAVAQVHDTIRGADGSFAKSVKFIERCLAQKINVSVITTVHKKNLDQLSALEKYIAGKNIAWQIQAAGGEGKRFSREYLLNKEEFYSLGLFIAGLRQKYSVKKMPVIGAHDMGYHSYFIPNVMLCNSWQGCQAGISVMGVQSNGGLKACLSMNNEHILGKWPAMGIAEFWNNDSLFSDTRGFNGNMLGPNCINCKFGDSCRGGCTEMSLMSTGKKHNNPYCFYSIEQDLFSSELKNPFKKAYLNFKQKMNASSRNTKNLFKRFSGK